MEFTAETRRRRGNKLAFLTLRLRVSAVKVELANAGREYMVKRVRISPARSSGTLTIFVAIKSFESRLKAASSGLCPPMSGKALPFRSVPPTP